MLIICRLERDHVPSACRARSSHIIDTVSRMCVVGTSLSRLALPPDPPI